MEAAEYERISRLNARHLFLFDPAFIHWDVRMSHDPVILLYNDTWNYFISLFQSSIDFFPRYNESNKEKKKKSKFVKLGNQNRVVEWFRMVALVGCRDRQRDKWKSTRGVHILLRNKI